jgi:signal peptidase I
MAPALLGNHKAVVCPRCGYEVCVGHRDDSTGSRGSDSQAECPNCGFNDLPLEQVPVCRGDHLLVNKSVFTFRKPRRWEMAVFRCPAADGKAFVKRVIGLPGETVQIRGGDVYIDGEIARKSLDEFKVLAIGVFDQNFQPPQGWGCRWVVSPRYGQAAVSGKTLRMNAVDAPDEWTWLTYSNRGLDDGKVQPLRDEYTYNGMESRRAEPVHDFMLACDVEIARGEGTVAFSVTDGLEEITAEAAVGASQGESRLLGKLLAEESSTVQYRAAPGLHLAAGEKHQVELAFIDRRATLAIDGKIVFAPVDRPAIEKRPAVESPVRLGARGVETIVSNVRIFRDVHYTDAGRHGIRSPLRLGAGEYFVLGDNSPNSDDSRFWSDERERPLPVPEANFLGKPFLVHMPSRIKFWQGLGERWEFNAIDWERIRWLH